MYNIVKRSSYIENTKYTKEKMIRVVNRLAHYAGNRFFWVPGVAWPVDRAEAERSLFHRSRHCVSRGYQALGIIRRPDTIESRIVAGKSSVILRRASRFRDVGSLMLIN